MAIIRKNKKGLSIAELIAAIAIIGLASTTITSIVITSYRGQLRAQQYVLAKEIAKTYDSMLARDVSRTNLQTIDDSLLVNDDPNDKYVVVSQTLLQKMTKINETEFAPIYTYLYGSNTADHFQLNDMVFDNSNVQLKIYVLSKNFGYFKTEITVTYQGNRQVTYNGTHFTE